MAGRTRPAALAAGLIAGLLLESAVARWLFELAPGTFWRLVTPAAGLVLALAGGLFGLISAFILINRKPGSVPDPHLAIPALPLLVYLLWPNAAPLVGALALGLSAALAGLHVLHVSAPRLVRPAGAIAAAILALVIYVPSLSPAPLPGDSGELQAMMTVLGVPHPTGYPLYLILGHLFTRIPVVTPAYGASLFSAVTAAGAAALLYLLVSGIRHPHPSPLPSRERGLEPPSLTQKVGAELAPPAAGSDPPSSPQEGVRGRGIRISPRLIEEQGSGPPSPYPSPIKGEGIRPLAYPAAPALALVIAVWWAAAPLVRSQAIVAEVYALQAVLTVALFWVLWQEMMPWGRKLALVALGLGLGLAHHRTIVLLAPALAVGLAFSMPWRRLSWKPFGVAAGCLLAPLLLYLYLPLRWETLSSRPMTWQDFNGIVLASRFAPLLQPEALLSPDRYLVLLRVLSAQFGWAGLALALLGLAFLARADWRRALVLLTSFGGVAAFLIVYQVPDTEVFGIPLLVFTALLIAYGCAGMGRLVWRLWGSRGAASAEVAEGVSVVVALAAFAAVLLEQPLLGRWEAPAGPPPETYPLDAIPPYSLIIAGHDFSPLLYQAYAQQGRRDLTIIMPDTEDVSRGIIRDALAAGKAVYLARFLPNLFDQYRLSSVGPLVRVMAGDRPPITSPAGSSQFLFRNGPSLHSWDAPRSTGRGQQITASLAWDLAQPAADAFIPQLLLLRPDGSVQAQEDLRHPVAGMYPMTAWRPGETVADYRRLDVPWDTPTGPYRLAVRLVAPDGSAVPLAAPGQGTTVDLGEVSVGDGEGEPAVSQYRPALWGNDVIGLGASADTLTWEGGLLHVRLAWQGLGEQADPLRVAALLRDRSGGVIARAEATVPPLKPGKRFATEYTLPYLPGVALGSQLAVTVTRAGEQLAVRDAWWQPGRPMLPLAPLRLLALAPGEAIRAVFDGRILLLHTAVPATVEPGAPLSVDLTWLATSPLQESYTVFVHVADAQGRPLAQQDIAPAGGTFPTDRWKPGERVRDLHTIPITLPPGTYHVRAGLYLPASLRRLAVSSAAGQAQGDIVDLGTVTVR